MLKTIDKNYRLAVIRPTKRGPWSGNGIFGRCSCNGLTIRGVCQTCGYTAICFHCSRVRQADHTYRVQGFTWDNLYLTVCPECRRGLCQN